MQAAELLRKKVLQLQDLQILERHSDYGGVWKAATYPGAACDVFSCTYQVSWHRNPGMLHYETTLYLFVSHKLTFNASQTGTIFSLQLQNSSNTIEALPSITRLPTVLLSARTLHKPLGLKSDRCGSWTLRMPHLEYANVGLAVFSYRLPEHIIEQARRNFLEWITLRVICGMPQSGQQSMTSPASLWRTWELAQRLFRYYHTFKHKQSRSVYSAEA